MHSNENAVGRVIMLEPPADRAVIDFQVTLNLTPPSVKDYV